MDVVYCKVLIFGTLSYKSQYNKKLLRLLQNSKTMEHIWLTDDLMKNTIIS